MVFVQNVVVPNCAYWKSCGRTESYNKACTSILGKSVAFPVFAAIFGIYKDKFSISCFLASLLSPWT
jgi:hypothetical protein